MHRTLTTTRTTQTILILILLVTLIASGGSNSHAYAMPDVTARGYVWKDVNCDGMRQLDEPFLIGQTIYLFAAGSDGVINTSDDQAIEQSSVGFAEPNLGKYRFTFGITDLDYALAVLPKDRPAGMYPGPLNAGDDRSIDNDMRADLWVTNGFRMSETETVTGIDIGLCQVQLPLRLYLPAILR